MKCGPWIKSNRILMPWKNGNKHGKGIRVFQKTIIITTNADDVHADEDGNEDDDETAYKNVHADENENEAAYTCEEKEVPISVKKSIDLKINTDIQHTLQEISDKKLKKRKNRWTRLLFSCLGRL